MKPIIYYICIIILLATPQSLLSQEKANTSDENNIISAYNEFGCDIFNKLSIRNDKAFNVNNRKNNIFISPLSLALNIAIAYNGAEDETELAIAKTLHFSGVNLEEINAKSKQLIDQICLKPDSRNINIANSIWLSESKKWKFKESFLSKIHEYFDASAFRGLDIDTINHWINEKTHGRIGNINVEFDDLSAAVILNTIYFNDKWEYPFVTSFTRTEEFYLCDGSIKKIDMMSQVDSYYYYENDEFQEVELKFKSDFGLIVFLPKNDGCLRYHDINKLYKEFNENSKRYSKGHIKIPKFIMKFEMRPKDILSELGMEIAFDTSKANFTEMAYFDPIYNLYIEEIIHSTFLQINEIGAEAAAATFNHLKGGGTSPPEFKIIVNKPFYLVIRNTNNNNILFIGAVYDPQNI